MKRPSTADLLAVALVALLSGCASTSNLPPRRPWNDPREQLDKGDIVYAMQQIAPAVGRCFDRFRTTGLYSAAFTIVGDGHVKWTNVRGPHTETSYCISLAVATATFPRFSGAPQSIVYPFVLR